MYEGSQTNCRGHSDVCTKAEEISHQLHDVEKQEQDHLLEQAQPSV